MSSCFSVSKISESTIALIEMVATSSDLPGSGVMVDGRGGLVLAGVLVGPTEVLVAAIVAAGPHAESTQAKTITTAKIQEAFFIYPNQLLLLALRELPWRDGKTEVESMRLGESIQITSWHRHAAGSFE